MWQENDEDRNHNEAYYKFDRPTVCQQNIMKFTAGNLYNLFGSQRFHQFRNGFIRLRIVVAQLTECIRSPREHIAPFIDRNRVCRAAAHFCDNVIFQTFHQIYIEE